jgi:hypothetical protein
MKKSSLQNRVSKFTAKKFYQTDPGFPKFYVSAKKSVSGVLDELIGKAFITSFTVLCNKTFLP